MDIAKIRLQSKEPVSLDEAVPVLLDPEHESTEACSGCDGSGVVHACHSRFCTYPEHGCAMCNVECPECGAPE
jgi:hypothetical protein